MGNNIQLQRFEITLDANKRLYQLGDTLRGKLVIGLEGELQLSKIRMEAMGMAEVDWSEYYGRTTYIYRADLKYLLMNYDFIGNRSNGIITKGIHEFPFSFQLPNGGIPSSFDGFHGKIQYWIEAEIEKPMFSSNHKTRTGFEVEAPLFCENPMLPICGSNEKKLEFLCMNSGDIDVFVTLPKRGFYAGEIIPINFNINNRSARRVSPRATLKQTQLFIVKGYQKTKKIKYMRIDGTPVDPGLTNVQTINVPVPANIQLSNECPILMVSYDVHLTVDIPWAINLHIDLPIIITTEAMMIRSWIHHAFFR